MKSLLSCARNIRHWIVEGKLLQEIEAVFTITDKVYQYVGGDLVGIETTETVRFSLTVDGARRMAKNLIEWADAAQDESTQLTLKTDL